MAIKFSDKVIEEAWERSKGRCECTNSSHYHGHSRCNIKLYKPSRGKDSRMGWEANPIDPKGNNSVENCEIICHSCYSRIHSFGI